MTEPGAESDASPDPTLQGQNRSLPLELEIIGGTNAADGNPSSEQRLIVPGDYRPRKRLDVLELDMGDGVILYDDDASLVHHLNPSASLIWHLCDGSGSSEELAHDIAEEYGLDRTTVAEQVMTVIGELDALGLVEDARIPGQDGLRPGS